MTPEQQKEIVWYLEERDEFDLGRAVEKLYRKWLKAEAKNQAYFLAITSFGPADVMHEIVEQVKKREKETSD